MSQFYIATTRFTNETFFKNQQYKDKLNINGAIYGSPMRVKDTLPLDCNIFVIEMNNSKNKIEGIGLIKNYTHHDKYYRIYHDESYYPGTVKKIRFNKNGEKSFDIIYHDDETETEVDACFVQLKTKEKRDILKGDEILVNCRKRPNKDYNRYVYKGRKRIDVNIIDDPYFKKVITVLEQLLFKGARHVKRCQGISQLPKWIIQNKYKFDFIKCFNNMFNKYLK